MSSPTDATSGAATVQLVLADAGAVVLAVAVEAVAGAVAWPARLDRLPRRGGAVCGVLDYFGQAIALLDLALWVDLGTPSATPRSYQRALVLHQGGRMVAIGVDQVRGLQRVAHTAIEQLSHDDDPQQIFHSTVRCAGVAGLACLLDVDRLMALAQTWSDGAETGARHDGAAGASASVAAPAAAPRTYGVVAGNGCRIAFPINDLAEVLPVPPLLPFHSPLSEGLCQWRGRHVPVTSIAKCFPALWADGSAPAPLLAILQRDGLLLGMLIDQVPDIVQLPAADTTADSIQADADGALIHLPSMAALHARFPETVLSREGATGAPVTTTATNVGSHLVYEAASTASTPLDGIEAVLDLPPLPPGATEMAWRGAPLALRDLRAAPGPAGTVIVLRDAQPAQGYIVDAVRTLVRERSASVSHIAVAGRGAIELLTTGTGAGRATYVVGDLAKLAKLAAPAAP
ncbi:chemotaxis protein CheW [Massilia sp. DWR3-1-1]|uniref:chemotaxis protein CheW n=1 Tax=Massilia sp. DWR3-1-1 TaxID=2804559 RepID=UPI003CFBA1AF